MFTLGGKFRLKMGGVGRGTGTLLHPAGVCTDKYGNVFVADRDNHRVQMFDKSGKRRFKTFRALFFQTKNVYCDFLNRTFFPLTLNG